MDWDDEEARRNVARTEDLLGALEDLPDHLSAARARDAVQGLVDLYGACLTRIAGHLAGDPAALRRLAGDELVGHLLLVHDLHPDPVATRVAAAVEEAAAVLRAQGGDAELLDAGGPPVRVRVTAPAARGCGCGSGPGAEQSPEDLVRTAVLGRAPEVEEVDVETAQPAAARPLIPVDALFRTPAAAREPG